MPLLRSLHPRVLLTFPLAPCPPSLGDFLAMEVAKEGMEEEEGLLSRAHKLHGLWQHVPILLRGGSQVPAEHPWSTGPAPS